MANIIVDIPNVTGEATMAGYVDKLEAIAMVDVIKAAVENTKTQVSEINVTRYRDRASPKLAEHCSVGTNLGDGQDPSVQERGERFAALHDLRVD